MGSLRTHTRVSNTLHRNCGCLNLTITMMFVIFAIIYLCVGLGDSRSSCDTSLDQISNCDMKLSKTWDITQDTTVTDVQIECETMNSVCISVQPGISFNMKNCTLDGSSSAYCILVNQGKLNIMDETLVHGCGNQYGNLDTGLAVVGIQNS